jgi:aspartate/methionine/tyrosine aminotransferase
MVNSIFNDCGTSIFEEMSRLAATHGAINLGQGFPVGLEPAEVLDCQGTYFLCVGADSLGGRGDDAELCRRLTIEAGVTPVPVSSFYAPGDVRSHFRFCFAKRPDDLAAALNRLAAWR